MTTTPAQPRKIICPCGHPANEHNELGCDRLTCNCINSERQALSARVAALEAALNVSSNELHDAYYHRGSFEKCRDKRCANARRLLEGAK